MMRFIAAQAQSLRGPQDAFRLCCKLLGAEDDLTYRRGMVALFDRPPVQGNFAALKSIEVTYHVYRAENLQGIEDLPWVSIGTEVATSDTEKWVFRHHENMIQTWTNAPELLPKLIASGAGRGVLPSYIGDKLQGVVRDGEALEQLSHTLWLVFNDDDRHSPEMRLVIDRLAALLKHNETLLQGRPQSDNRSEASIIAFPRS